MLDNKNTYDLIIVGCGPAGLSAAINAQIRNKKFLLIGGEYCLEKIYKAPRVDNYLGFFAIQGSELKNKFLEHVQKMGIEIQNKRVDAIYPLGKIIQVMVQGEVYSTTALIIGTGLSTPKYIKGEKDLLGKGVGYCATCDGPLYKGKRVIVLGETEEAQEEANYLADICDSVIYLSLHGHPENLKENIKIGEGKPLAVQGEQVFKALETDKAVYEADGLFIIRKETPVQDILPGLNVEKGYIEVDRTMQTNIPGVFAAGDCTGPPYQIAKAVGEGLTAALNAVKYIDSKGEGSK